MVHGKNRWSYKGNSKHRYTCKLSGKIFSERQCKNVYTLSGADANGYKYVSLSGVSITQPVLTDVKAENKSENLTADKFKDGDTLTLKASYNEKKLGTANYDVTYQWYKLNEKTNKYDAIKSATTETYTTSTFADIPGTYYCEITADVKGSVKIFFRMQQMLRLKHTANW